MQPEPDDLVSVDDAALKTGISRSTLYRRIISGVLDVWERADDGLYRVSLRDVQAMARYRRRRPGMPRRKNGDGRASGAG